MRTRSPGSAQTGLDVALYAEHDAEAAFPLLEVKAKVEVKAPASTIEENQAHEVLNHINSCQPQPQPWSLPLIRIARAQETDQAFPHSSC
jgi:hypothetical protein